MRIRTKILLSHVVLLTTITFACLAIVAALAYIADDRRRLLTSYEQLKTSTSWPQRRTDRADRRTLHQWAGGRHRRGHFDVFQV